jgi:uncharacterized membrane protein
LSVLRSLSDGDRVAARSAAVVKRDAGGSVHIGDGFDAQTGEATAVGSVTGMLVGVLGGPLGMLLGASTGALAGGAIDLDRASTSDEALSQVNKIVSPGQTVLVAEVTEYAPEVLDREMNRIGGTTTRRPTADVVAELDAADESQPPLAFALEPLPGFGREGVCASTDLRQVQFRRAEFGLEESALCLELHRVIAVNRRRRFLHGVTQQAQL